MARESGSAFLRLDRTSWRISAGSRELVVDRATGALELGREGQHAIAPHEPFGSFGGRTLARGVAVWPDGQLLLADPHGDQILYFRNPFGDALRPEEAPDHWPFRELWTPPEEAPPPPLEAALEPEEGAASDDVDPYRLRAPADVARTPRGELVVADSCHARLLVFTWPELRVRAVVPVPEGEPRAVAFDGEGRAYVADVAGRVRRYDALWRPDPAYGAPDAEGSTGLVRPEHVAVDAQGRVFVVDSGTQRVVLLDAEGRPVPGAGAVPSELFDADFPPPLALTDERLTHPQLGRVRCGALMLRGVRVDRRGRLDGTALPLLARSQRIVLPRSGSYLSEALDGEAAGFPWHRLVLDVEVPESGRLVVSTLTAEEPLELARVHEIAGAFSLPLVIRSEDVPEVLVQSPPGRFMWIRVDLLGDGERTPRVHRIDVFGPRQSSLALLPPPYHEVEESAHFLDRLLSYFDTMYAETEAALRDFARLLDPYAVPVGPFLEWLGSWFDWRFLAQWPEATRREMIAESVRFFRERGTVRGIRRLLQWHTGLPDPFPQIIEHFRLRDYAARRNVPDPDLPGGRLYLGGRRLEPDGGALAHRFTVVLPSSAVRDAEARAQLVRLIEAQKPAHTDFSVRAVEPGVRIGCQSSVGVDTWLGDYSREVLGRSTLGRTAHLDSERTAGPRVGATFLSD